MDDDQHDELLTVSKVENVVDNLANSSGIVVRQVAQLGESIAQAIGAPWEAKNKYKTSILPAGKKAGTSHSDGERWKPTAEELEGMDMFLFGQEESDTCARICLNFCGCGSLRKLTMHLRVSEATGDVFVIKKPFACGAWIGCPLQMDLFGANQDHELIHIGRVKENFDNYCLRCFECCCKCTHYHDVMTVPGQGTLVNGLGTTIIAKQPSETVMEKVAGNGAATGFKTDYTVRTTTCCCGRVNNCCGATCFRDAMIFDILDGENASIKANIQKTYAGGANGCNDICRMCFEFSNYIIEFPPDSTPHQRVLLLTSMIQIEYEQFEKDGGDGG